MHDWEPGIQDSGLFWTIPIGNGAIDVDPSTGAARFRGQSVKVTDYHDFFNAVLGGGPTPLPSPRELRRPLVRATARARRSATRRSGSSASTSPSTASISFVAMDDHGSVIYRSDPAGQTNVGQPAVGTERNGVFFH